MLYRFTAPLATSVLVVLVFGSSLRAQTTATVPEDDSAAQPQVASEAEKPLQFPELKTDGLFSKGFLRQMMSDEKQIWTSPARIHASDAKWLVPLAAGTGFLFTQDNNIVHHFDNRTSLQNASLKISNLGSYATWGVPGAFLTIGKLSGNDHLAQTGERGFQAALYSMITMQTLKALTNRTRPYQGGTGHFWTGGSSFPSGHSMEAWALAKVVSDSYPDKRFVKIGMYSFATAVSLSRLTSERHYASDVLVGSSLGYLMGKFVMRNQHTESQVK
jgi:membrane-associated phospholipid phosphatase